MASSEYLLARIQRTDGCWEWTGPVQPNGYGLANLGRHGRQGAHRAVYELLVGPIESGLQLDHRCHNEDVECPGGKGCRHRRCVNPSHLEQVTIAVNVTRGKTRPALNLAKEACPAGHAYTHTNPRGWRKCATCIKAQVEARARARGVPARRRGAPECPRGHAYTEATTRWSKGKRYCKTCDHDRMVAAAEGRRKPCRACGGPKESGAAYAYCTGCRPRVAA